MTDDPFEAAKIRTSERLNATAERMEAGFNASMAVALEHRSKLVGIIDKYGLEFEKEGYTFLIEKPGATSASIGVYYSEMLHVYASDSEGNTPPPSIGVGVKPILELGYREKRRFVYYAHSKIGKFDELEFRGVDLFEDEAAQILGSFLPINRDRLTYEQSRVLHHREVARKIDNLNHKKIIVKLTKIVILCFVFLFLYKLFP